MCLGVPGRVVDRLVVAGGELAVGLVEFDGLRRQVCLELVPHAAVGDYVIVHAGIAINAIDETEAERLLEYLREMAPDELPGEPAP